MHAWKKSDVTITVIMAAVLLASFVLMYFTDIFHINYTKDEEVAAGTEYSQALFGSDIKHINIVVDNSKWQEMIKNKEEKQYIPCDMEINGQTFKNVGIRPKGYSTLNRIDNDRISLRVNFSHYVDNQTCYGLKNFVLNNTYADATYMKDYIAYDLMEHIGVKAPLHTFAYITLNGKPFGVYLMAEVYKKDYLQRAFGDTSIKLYDVKVHGLDSYERAKLDPDKAKVITSSGIVTVNEEEDHGRGGDLVYMSNRTDDYTSIFANAVFNDTTAGDYARVLRAIKRLNEENVTADELEKYWDIDEILRYLAVNTFMVNDDSYGGTAQNYYIAEKNGKLAILPWDYNLSFGGRERRTDDLSDKEISDIIINSAIDTPVKPDVSMESRPLISVLLSFDAYKDRYHDYLSQLTDYVFGDFIDKLNKIENSIYPYIQKENVRFYTPKEQKKAFDVLPEFLKLRCESIKKQLDGSIASVTEEQNPDTFVKSDISIKDMGFMAQLHKSTENQENN